MPTRSQSLTQRRPAALLAILAALIVSACAGMPMSMPSAPPPTIGGPSGATGDPATGATACATDAQPAATALPGWPPAATFELVPVPVSSELAVGSNRFLVNLLDSRNEPLAAPDRALELRFFNLAEDPDTAAATVPATYMATTDDLPGLYRAEVTFPCSGDWGLEAVAREPDGSERTGRMIFSVRDRATTPAIGAPAPRSSTPTAASADEIAAISTDTEPDPAFYAMSVDQALDDGRPFLLIFSTPAFCRTRTCGPALDIVKSVAPEYEDDVTFIHVEPYQLTAADGQVQPVLSDQNLPIPVAAVTEWGLPTEPYIFVVDADGKVAAKMEGVASADEIRAALEGVAESD